MIERHLVPGEPEPFSHYCHVVRADRHVYVSGAVGIKSDGSVPSNTTDQFRLERFWTDEPLFFHPLSDYGEDQRLRRGVVARTTFQWNPQEGETQDCDTCDG